MRNCNLRRLSNLPKRLYYGSSRHNHIHWSFSSLHIFYWIYVPTYTIMFFSCPSLWLLAPHLQLQHLQHQFRCLTSTQATFKINEIYKVNFYMMEGDEDDERMDSWSLYLENISQSEILIFKMDGSSFTASMAKTLLDPYLHRQQIQNLERIHRADSRKQCRIMREMQILEASTHIKRSYLE